MALVKWEPKRREVEPIRGLRDEVDRLFDQFFRGWGGPFAPGWPGARWPALSAETPEFLPVVNLKETQDDYVVTAEVPGLDKKELEITLTDDSVTLKGERKAEKNADEENYHYQEASYGRFERLVSLPGRIKTVDAKARLKDGVLTLTLPKAEESKRKEVKVKVE